MPNAKAAPASGLFGWLGGPSQPAEVEEPQVQVRKSWFGVSWWSAAAQQPAETILFSPVVVDTLKPVATERNSCDTDTTDDSDRHRPAPRPPAARKAATPILNVPIAPRPQVPIAPMAPIRPWGAPPPKPAPKARSVQKQLGAVAAPSRPTQPNALFPAAPGSNLSRAQYGQLLHMSENAQQGAQARAEKEERKRLQEQQKEKMRARALELRRRPPPSPAERAAERAAAAKKTPSTVITLANMTSNERAVVAKHLWSPVLCDNERFAAPREFCGC